MYVGFGNGRLGIWNMITPIDSIIDDEKQVIFDFEPVMINCQSHKIEIIDNDYIIGLNR